MTDGTPCVLASELAPPRIETGAADEGVLSSSESQKNRTDWQRVFDQLIEWGVNPERLADDDVVPPTGAALATAARIARSMRGFGAAPPARVAPNGTGGVVFERGDVQSFVTIEIDEDGSAEYLEFRGCSLVGRGSLSVEG